MAAEADADDINAFNFADYELDPGPSVEHGSPSGEEDSRPAAQTQLEDLGVQDLGVDDIVAQPAIRKPRPTLNADRLLDPRRGYPALLKSLRKVKYRGRGDEKKYLQTYVMTYQIWANRAWPKATFNDFMGMARRVGTDPRIRRYCRSLIEQEKYGRDELPADAPKEAARESVHPVTASPANTTSESPEPVTNPLREEHGATQPVASNTTTSSEKSRNNDIPPEFDFLGDPNEEGPDADELEAAMELYGDMDF